MYPTVTTVAAKQNYLVEVDFNNGERGTLDMKPFLDFGVFKQIKDYAVFKTVKVSFDTIEWAGGIDLDPQFVYDKCIRK